MYNSTVSSSQIVTFKKVWLTPIHPSTGCTTVWDNSFFSLAPKITKSEKHSKYTVDNHNNSIQQRRSSGTTNMEISKCFENAPLVAKVCPKCVSGDFSIGVPVVPSPTSIKQHKSWCSVAKCTKCDFRWYVCRSCTHVRTVLDTTRKLNAHAAKNHSQGIRLW